VFLWRAWSCLSFSLYLFLSSVLPPSCVVFVTTPRNVRTIERRGPQKTSVSQRWRSWRASSLPSLSSEQQVATRSWDFGNINEAERKQLKNSERTSELSWPERSLVWNSQSFWKVLWGWRLVSQKYHSDDMIIYAWRATAVEDILCISNKEAR